MKPLHVGLLVIGAALAGGLAVKMSQPPGVSSAGEKRVVVAPPVAAAKAAVTPPAAPPATVAEADAPPPVYSEPAHAEKPARVVEKAKLPLPPAPKAAPATAVKAAPPAEPPVTAKLVPYQEPTAAAPAPDPTPEAPRAPEPPPVRQVTLQAGSTVPVRLLQTISTEHAVAGDTFQATLAEPLVVDGLVVAERGARASGRIIDAKTSGRFSGVSVLQLSLSNIQTADGQRIAITTEPWAKQSEANARERNDAVRIGGGAALGAIIGAIAGGGKGAAIGAGAGGAAGAGSVAAQRPKALEVPSETLIRFRLASRVTITERPL